MKLDNFRIFYGIFLMVGGLCQGEKLHFIICITGVSKKFLIQIIPLLTLHSGLRA